MGDLEKKITAVRRRLRLFRLLDWTFWGLIAGLTAAVLLLLVLKLFPNDVPRVEVGAAVAAGILLGAFVAALVRRISLMDAALYADTRLQLRERISSALALARVGRSESRAFPALEADARRYAQAIQPRRDFRYKMPRHAKHALWPALALVAVYFIPQMNLFGNPPPPPAAQRTAAPLMTPEQREKRVQKLRELAEEARKAEEENLAGTPEDLKLADRLERLSRDLSQGRKSDREVVAEMSRLSEELKIQERAFTKEMMPFKQLKGLQRANKTKDLRQDMKNQDFESAAERLQKMAEMMQNPGQMSPNEMDQLASEMDELAQSMKDNPQMAESMGQAAQAMKQMAEAAQQQQNQQQQQNSQNNQQQNQGDNQSQSGEGQNQGSQKQTANQQGSSSQSQGQQGQSQSMQQASQQASASLQQAAQQMQGMQQAMANAQRASELQNSLSQATASSLGSGQPSGQQGSGQSGSSQGQRRPGSMGGQGQGSAQSQAGGPRQGVPGTGEFQRGNPQNQGMGTGGAGRGMGGNPPDDGSMAQQFDDVFIPGQQNEGEIIAFFETEATAPKGESKLDYTRVPQAYRQKAADSIVDQEIPAGMRNAVRDYFESINFNQPEESE